MIEMHMDTASNEEKGIVTRIAPSPTGLLHIGTARTALFNFLYARRYGGKFIVRVEDTDTTRSKKEFEENILEGLAWLGFAHDELYRQSERTEIYTQELSKAITSGSAFLSREESKQEPGKEVDVVRLKNPNKKITFEDEVRGDITFDTTELGDFVIARSQSEPLYHFAVVVDDALMDITHVIRGEDHISNTPRQILIQEALSLPRPIYAHLPLILAPDRTKLSKRHGAVSVFEYKAKGFLPEAINNYLALLGWNPGTDEEIFALSELIEHFDLSGVQKGGAIFNLEKLTWLNREHIKRHMQEDPESVKSAVLDALAKYPSIRNVFRNSQAAFDDLLERINTYTDAELLAADGEFAFYAERPALEDPAKLLWKKDPEPKAARQHLAKVHEVLENIEDTDFLRPIIESALDPYATEMGKGNVLWPMRYALSGRDRSPDPYTLAEALGKNETLTRLATATAALEPLCSDDPRDIA